MMFSQMQYARQHGPQDDLANSSLIQARQNKPKMNKTEPILLYPAWNLSTL